MPGSACARLRRISARPRLVGLDVNRLIVVAFAIASAFAGLAGVLWAAQAGIVEPHMGFTPLLKAFVAAIIGGFGSIAGALVGGYVLGALEVFIVAFLPSEVSPYRDAIVFALLIAFLLFRPNGLLNRTQEVEAVSRTATLLLASRARAARVVTLALPQLFNDYVVRVVTVMCINARPGRLDGARQRLYRRLLARPCRLRRGRRLCLRHPSLSARREALLPPRSAGWLASFSLSFLPATIVAGLVCAGLAFVVGAPLMRLSGYFVSVATLGFLIIVNVVLINAVDYTRGARTFTGVPLETTLPWAAAGCS